MAAPERVFVYSTDMQSDDGYYLDAHPVGKTDWHEPVEETQYIRADIYESDNAKLTARVKELEEAAKGQCVIVNQAKDMIKQLESQLALQKITSEPLYSRRQLEGKLERIKAACEDVINSDEYIRENGFQGRMFIDFTALKSALSQAIESEA